MCNRLLATNKWWNTPAIAVLESGVATVPVPTEAVKEAAAFLERFGGISPFVEAIFELSYGLSQSLGAEEPDPVL